MERLTAEQVRTLPLPMNPIARVRQIRKYAGEMVGPMENGRLPFVFTRGWLVRYAHLGELQTTIERVGATVGSMNDDLRVDLIEMEINNAVNQGNFRQGEIYGKDF